MAIRRRLAQFPDPQVLADQGQWQQFVETLIQGHEEDLQEVRQHAAQGIEAVRQEIMNVQRNLTQAGNTEAVKGLPLKDMKPDKFESNKKSEQSFKQWSEDVLAWVKRLDTDYVELIKAATSMTEWNRATYGAKLLEKGIQQDKQQDLDATFMDILKKFTKGDARDLVDTTSISGEAWYRLNDRYYAKTVIGATRIASTLQEMKRPNSLSESFPRLTEIRGLVKEFQRQSPSEPMPTAIIKAAYMKVVPEAYKKGLEMQVDVDRSDVSVIEDKIMTFIRSNVNGLAGMGLDSFDAEQPGQGQGKGPATCMPIPSMTGCATCGPSSSSWSSTGTGAYNMQAGWDAWPHYGEFTGQENGMATEEGVTETNAFMKGKGKGKPQGKGIFHGRCYACGQIGHSQRYCPENQKGKVKGKKGNGGKFGGKSSSFNYFGGDGGTSYGPMRGGLGIPAMALEKYTPETDEEWHLITKHVRSASRSRIRNIEEKNFRVQKHVRLLAGR